MTVTFYTCSDDPRKIKKTLTETSVQENVHIYDGCSIISPILVMRYEPAILTSNYMYIDDWDMYYAMGDVTVDNGKRMYVPGQLDAMYTYRNQILACPATAIRNEGIGRPTYVPDASLPLYPASDYYTSLSIHDFGNNYPGDYNYLIITK